MVYEPLTKLQCCPTSDGAGAAIVVSEDFVEAHNLQNQAVEIVGMAMTTDFSSTFDEKSCIKMVGFDMTQGGGAEGLRAVGARTGERRRHRAARLLLVQRADHLRRRSVCAREGKGGELIDSGAVTYGGKWVVNPSGGLISKGHPLGATGLAQCAELNWQLRGKADKRQVAGAKVALQHNLGLGGAAVVTMYRKAAFAG